MILLSALGHGQAKSFFPRARAETGRAFAARGFLASKGGLLDGGQAAIIPSAILVRPTNDLRSASLCILAVAEVELVGLTIDWATKIEKPARATRGDHYVSIRLR